MEALEWLVIPNSCIYLHALVTKNDICSFQALSKEESSANYLIAGSTCKAERKNFKRMGKQIPCII